MPVLLARGTRALTHPLAPAIAAGAGACVLVAMVISGNPPWLALSWVVMALAAGYSISGSV